MDDTKRREALRKYSYRSAAAEQEPELSGMLPTQHQAMIDEEMRQRFPNELQGIEEAKAALDVAAQVWENSDRPGKRDKGNRCKRRPGRHHLNRQSRG
jgi:hypothetical protein